MGRAAYVDLSNHSPSLGLGLLICEMGTTTPSLQGGFGVLSITETPAWGSALPCSQLPCQVAVP